MAFDAVAEFVAPEVFDFFAGDAVLGEAGAFDAAGIGTGVDFGIGASDAGLADAAAGVGGFGAADAAVGAAGAAGADGILVTAADAAGGAAPLGASVPAAVDPAVTASIASGAGGAAAGSSGASLPSSAGSDLGGATDPTAPDAGKVDPTAAPAQTASVGDTGISSPDLTGAAGVGAPALSGGAVTDSAATGAESFGGSAGGSSGLGGGVPGEAGAFDASGMGTGVDAGTMSSDAGLADATRQSELEKSLAKLGITKSSLDKALGAATKYGPLALAAGSTLAQRQAAKKYPGQIAAVGGPQRDVANQMIAQAQAGQINPADQFAIDQWQQGAITQARAYYAKAGLSDSSMAKSAEAEINAKAVAMKEQARQQLLQTGIDTLNITDKSQVAAIQAEMAGDQASAKQITDFMNSYGAWLRALPALSGPTKTASGATAPAA